MAFDSKLLDIIACPVCKGKLRFDKDNSELISTAAKLAYPVKDDIPVLLENEARELSLEEVEKWNS
ncbi:Trm112 family protein [Pseudoalteromonas sp. APM04]|jgi:uncharacterized protein YbaR (Trm112 family)|uniref:Trm112 family protein n=1 Tax=Pseudoalteromonas sp. APM04 TaxID=2699396 RepID=UPI001FB2DA4D|nr:Trm112 family protein [Pseudoalteromonas sp. APM04]UOB72235.1 Trm112 family protein [Pseudoalteromonas sp. APM04]